MFYFHVIYINVLYSVYFCVEICRNRNKISMSDVSFFEILCIVEQLPIARLKFVISKPVNPKLNIGKLVVIFVPFFVSNMQEFILQVNEIQCGEFHTVN